MYLSPGITHFNLVSDGIFKISIQDMIMHTGYIACQFECIEDLYNFLKETLLDLCFCLERFPLPLGAWDGLRYFIVALPSI